MKTPSGNSTTRYQSTFLDVVANRPELKGSGGLGADGFVTAHESSQFLKASLDVDAIVTAMTGIPFGIDACINVVLLKGCANLDVLDLDLALDTSLQRTVAFKPTVMATYHIEDGRTFTVDANTDYSFALLDGYHYDRDVGVTVEYRAAGNLHTTTSIDAGLDLELDFLKGEADLQYRRLACKFWQLHCRWKWKDVVDVKFGPLLERDWRLFDHQFALGSEDYDLATAFTSTWTTSFTVPVGARAGVDYDIGAIGTTAWSGAADLRTVPEPATAALALLAGLLGLACRPRGRGGVVGL